MNKWDQRFLDLAQLVATWSKDPSTQVGAAIMGPRRQGVAVGFNGFPQAMPDHEALYADRAEKYPRIVHAEINALIFAGQLPEGCSLYTYPFMPCDRCVVEAIQAGILRFVAPKATEEQHARWGAAFSRTRQYIAECHGELIEV